MCPSALRVCREPGGQKPLDFICDLSQFVIKAVTWHIDYNNTENVSWVLGRVARFTFDMHMKSVICAQFSVISIVYLFVCVSVLKSITDVARKSSLNCFMCMWMCFLYLGFYPRVLLTSIWEVVFWTVTNSESHKLRWIRNPCRRNLWFVAICDQGCYVAYWFSGYLGEYPGSVLTWK